MNETRFSKGDDNTPAALVIDRRGAVNVYRNGQLVTTVDGWSEDVQTAVIAHAKKTYPHVTCYADCIAMGYQTVATAAND